MNSLQGKSWFSQFGQILTAIILGIALVACGGGKKSDRTPNPFSFSAQTGVELSTVVESNSITVSDINKSVAITVTGGEYSIAGGAFTSSAGEVTEGQAVTVRLTSSDSYSTQTSATLTIGGVSGTFSVTTLDDTTPDAFAFSAQTEVALSTQVSSNEVTISGINVAAPIVVSGGEYSIDGGEFTAEDGSIEATQTLVVRQTSSVDPETVTEMTLTIGGVSGVFSVTTQGRYTFEGFTGVALNARLQTHIVAISDIGDSTPISIENGEYQIDRGAWTDQAGFIDNNQKVRVRANAGDDYGVTTTARLNIGESWGVFNLTNKEHGDFISIWKTDNPGFSNDDQITLPLDADGNYDFTVDWGDGSTDQITQWDQAEVTHTYTSAGEYSVVISGTIEGFSFETKSGEVDREKIIEIQSWGTLKLSNNSSGSFSGALNLVLTADDALDLSGVESLSSMFVGASNFDGNIENWDISSVTSLSSFMEGADAYSGELSRWNVSQVTNFKDMLSGATKFNGKVGQWDIRNATDMDGMLDLTGMSTENYSEALLAWSQLTGVPESMEFSALEVFYNESAIGARSFLINDKGWFITDNGLEP